MSPFFISSSAAIAPHKTSQQGFTLIELMIALVIFAMLALAGWQIMDSLTKSRERGYQHQKSLSQLDYAYLQLSQDLAQTSNYVAVPILSATAYANANANANNTASVNSAAMTPTFVLNASQISFIRFAAPDPRYQSSPMLAKIQYSVAGETLTKRRFYQLDDNNETPATSVLLTGIKDASWRALTPDAVSVFPDEATLQKLQQIQAQKKTNQTTNPTPNPPDNATDQNSNLQNSIDLMPYQQLPRGIELNFSYQGEPITWRFALPSTPPNAPNP